MIIKLILLQIFILIVGIKGELKRNEINKINEYILIDNDGPQVPIVTTESNVSKYPRYPAQRIRTTRSKMDELTQEYLNPMMKLPELNYQYLSITMNRFITISLILVLLPTIMLSLFGDTGDLIFAQFAFISGIFGFCIGMLFFGGLLPDIMTIILSIIIGITNLYSTLKLTKVREMPYVSILFFCFLLSNLIYQLLAGINNYTINPLYTGLSGALIMHLSISIGYNFQNIILFKALLKFGYIIFVFLFSVIIYYILPYGLRKIYGNEKQNDEEIFKLQTCTQIISSFILSYPLIAFISQMMYIFGIFSTSPFDFLSFFYIPSQLYFNYYSTGILLFIWLILATSIFLFRTKITNRDSYQPKFVKTLIAEQWRLQES